jgi:hypothetical protein
MLRAFFLALVVATAVAGCGASQREAAPPRAAGEAAWKSLSPGWTRLSPPPFTRARALSVWTGADGPCEPTRSSACATIHRST